MIEVPAWLESLTRAFSASGHQLYLVGGAVREGLLGGERGLVRRRSGRLAIVTGGEWDLATDAKPTEVENVLRPLTKKIGLIGKRYGTVTAELKGHLVEITTFRSEDYAEFSRQPTVKFGATINEDLSRRDFTVNAVAYDLVGKQLLDPHQGQKDLGRQIIRAVGEP